MTDTLNPETIAELENIINRVERLEAEKDNISSHIKEVFDNAKNRGFNPKHIKRIIALKKIPEEKRVAEDEELDLYKAAVGLR